MEGFWLIDAQTKETRTVNPALCNMLGYKPEEILGKTPFEFVDEENKKIFIEQISRITTSDHRRYEITLKKKNGENLPVIMNASTLRDSSGKPTDAFAFVLDISEQKKK